jgi:hypothetical protein
VCNLYYSMQWTYTATSVISGFVQQTTLYFNYLRPNNKSIAWMAIHLIPTKFNTSFTFSVLDFSHFYSANIYVFVILCLLSDACKICNTVIKMVYLKSHIDVCLGKFLVLQRTICCRYCLSECEYMFESWSSFT